MNIIDGVSRAALVMSGGGARGAYQAGVLKALGEICGPLNKKKGTLDPFRILTGISAGTINAVALGAYAGDCKLATKILAEKWMSLTADQVFKTDPLSITKIGMRWFKDVSMGNLKKAHKDKSLLDTSPLRNFLSQNVPFDQIHKNIERGHIEAVAISAIDYSNSVGVTFVDANERVKMWLRSRRKSERTILNVDHAMASCAIPLFFPPIQVGESYFGDGCLRNSAPLSPAIHMGADHLIVIGVRKQVSQIQSASMDRYPSTARILSVVLNSIFMDGIEVDIERLARINSAIEMLSQANQEAMSFKPVKILTFFPSQDIGEIAKAHSKDLPRMIRYLIGGLGSVNDSSELVSYLLFAPDFCRELIELGYKDCLSQVEEIESFLTLSSPAK